MAQVGYRNLNVYFITNYRLPQEVTLPAASLGATGASLPGEIVLTPTVIESLPIIQAAYAPPEAQRTLTCAEAEEVLHQLVAYAREHFPASYPVVHISRVELPDRPGRLGDSPDFCVDVTRIIDVFAASRQMSYFNHYADSRRQNGYLAIGTDASFLLDLSRAELFILIGQYLEMFRPVAGSLSDEAFREYDRDVRLWNANCDVLQLQDIQREAGEQPLRLHVAWHDDITAFSLFRGGEPLIPITKKQTRAQLIRDLIAEIQEVTKRATSFYQAADAGRDAIRGDLERLGRSMYSRLLPAPIQEQLKATPEHELFLGLDAITVEIPWELLFDGEQFLCNRFQVGRHVFAEVQAKPAIAAARTVAGSPEAGQPRRILLIADPSGTLAGARRECEIIAAALGALPNVQVKVIGSEVQRSWDLLGEMSAGYDLVHYAGHARYDSADPSNSAWLLAQGELTASDVASLSPPPRLVFSNACESGATGAWRDGFTYEDKAFGLASGFLLAGVRGYIGTFWRVHDDASADLAVAFYRALLDGETVGGALAQARQAVITRHGWGEIVWASYMLYGASADRPFPQQP
ncbi:MAG: CHAT domain-containing protein [Chloroflexi bacterium]|nr:CHAT domain-containing protein [Chloroflexota bacterium]